MLNLRRRPGESIIINTGNGLVEVTVCGIKGDQVNVGITAPEEMDVDRVEVRERGIREGWRS